LLPRSLRLQKQQAIAQSLRDRQSSTYVQFAQMVRELAGVTP
jgi:hypothetical protein